MATEAPIHIPSDSLFKRSLTEVSVARAIFNRALPQQVLDILDLSSLTLKPNSYVDDKHKQSFSDVVYGVKTTQGEGYLYVLAEHQSKPDKFMAFRFLSYAIRIMENHMRGKNKKLPLVFPLLYYNGAVTPYPYSRDLFELFESSKLARELLFQPFALQDVSQLSDEEILTTPLPAFMDLMLKYKRGREDFMGHLESLFSSGVLTVLNDLDNGKYLNSLLYFMGEEMELIETGRLQQLLSQVDADAQGGAMTLHQRLREEGRQEGRKEVAIGMRDNGVSPEIIRAVTGFDVNTL